MRTLSSIRGEMSGYAKKRGKTSGRGKCPGKTSGAKCPTPLENTLSPRLQGEVTYLLRNLLNVATKRVISDSYFQPIKIVNCNTVQLLIFFYIFLSL